MKFSVAQYKIDWPNHLIGFFSALFGILIAFELEEWRDEKNQVEIARVAFENLKKEVQINQNSLHENIANNIRHINSLQSLFIKMDNQLKFVGSRAEADSINQNFNQVVFIEQYDSVKKVKMERPVIHIGMHNITIPTLQSSAWESAKATGALNLMEYEKVLSLSSLYNPPRILDELSEIRNLLRNSDSILNKTELSILLAEMEKAHRSIESELQTYDQFVNILNAME
jgi:hypothetical protein